MREYFEDLKYAKYTDRSFQAALMLARRSYQIYVNPSDETPETKLKQSFRTKGKSGPKKQHAEIRDELYQWVVDIRHALKGRLPRKMFIGKSKLTF